MLDLPKDASTYVTRQNLAEIVPLGSIVTRSIILISVSALSSNGNVDLPLQSDIPTLDPCLTSRATQAGMEDPADSPRFYQSMGVNISPLKV